MPKKKKAEGKGMHKMGGKMMTDAQMKAMMKKKGMK